MIVVGTNVLAYLYLPGALTRAAEALLERDPEWVSPILWRSGFWNILAGYLRRGAMTFDNALIIQEEAEDLLSGAEYEVDSRSVLELVRDSECSAYNCEFVALARRLGTTLVTADTKVRRAFPTIAVALATA
ncbi:MAG: type II toxin-antitoxin system VapC family toxin [Casimicrobiaceae bacterium]